MPKLGRAPTVENFARAFREEFAADVKDAAGRDGRLSRNEAERLAESGSVYGDNAVNYLEATGQQSVSVNKLIGSAEAYAFATAANVAGSNQRLSLLEARMLPQDLQADWAKLKGLDAPDAPVQGGGAFALDSAMTHKLDELVDDRWVSGWDVDQTLEGLDVAGQPSAAAEAIVSYVQNHPGQLDADGVEGVARAVRAVLTGHLYAPGGKDALAAELRGKSMGELGDLFGDWQMEVAERAMEPGAVDTPYFKAHLEGMRMINEAAVDKSNGDLTMLKVVVDDARSMWSDESIMDGIARPVLGEDAPGSNWRAVAKRATEEQLERLWGSNYEPFAAALPVDVTDDVVTEIATTIGQVGMGYGGTDDVPYRKLQLEEMFDELGPRDELVMLRSFTRDGDPGTRKRDVHNFTVVNPASGQHVNIFVYENSL